MNMAKLGIVSRVGNYFHSLGKRYKQRAGGMTRYTLCVFRGWAKRNGSRHSFAFDIPAIRGRTLFSVDKLVGSPGLTVIPGQVPPQGTSFAGQNCPQSLTGRGSRSKSTLKTTVPALAARPGVAMSSRLSTAEFPDLLPCGSAVTGEAGTVSGQSGQPAPQGKAAGIHPAASQQAPEGRAEGLTFSLTEAQRSALSFAPI